MNLLDCVETTEDVVADDFADPPYPIIKKGEVVTIIEVFTVPSLAYMIEAIHENYEGLVIATVLPYQIKPIRSSDECLRQTS